MASRVRTKTVAFQVTAVAIDSSYEAVTEAARKYRDEHVYPYLEQRGLQVKRLQGNLARRMYVEAAVIEPGVEFITGVGHGLQDLYTGQYGDQIFRVGKYDSKEVNPKIVHFLSCQTAAKLGPDFVRNGCRAYFGYDVNFTFHMDEADVYFECDSEVDRAFADGLTAGDVYKRVRALFEKNIAALHAKGKHYQASTLEMDLDHLRSPSDGVAWGDTAAKLS